MNPVIFVLLFVAVVIACSTVIRIGMERYIPMPPPRNDKRPGLPQGETGPSDG